MDASIEEKKKGKERCMRHSRMLCVLHPTTQNI